MDSYEEYKSSERKSTRSPRRSSGRSFGRSSDRSSGRDSGRSSGRRSSSRRSDLFDRRGRDEHVEMHKVVCDKCGVDCEVPFKPTAGKPVLCSDCFKKKGGRSNSSEELAKINEKLDKIMKALNLD